MAEVVVRTVPAKSVITKSNLPVCDFSNKERIKKSARAGA